MEGRAQPSGFVRPKACSDVDRAGLRCGAAAPFGCAGAEMYLRWYTDLRASNVSVETAYSYHTEHGATVGRVWPASDPCEVLTSDKDRSLLPRMIASWQRRARACARDSRTRISPIGLAAAARNQSLSGGLFRSQARLPRAVHRGDDQQQDRLAVARAHLERQLRRRVRVHADGALQQPALAARDGLPRRRPLAAHGRVPGAFTTPLARF